MWAFAEQYNWWWWWYKDTYFNRIENILLGMCVCALVYLFLVTTYNWGVNVSWPSEVKKWIQVYIVLLLLLRWLMNYFISFSLCVSRYTWFLPALWDETSTCRHRDSGCDPIFTIRCSTFKINFILFDFIILQIRNTVKSSDYSCTAVYKDKKYEC